MCLALPSGSRGDQEMFVAIVIGIGILLVALIKIRRLRKARPADTSF